MIGHFLGGIAALIWDEASGRYLLLRRSKHKDFAGGEWECVTGRVDQGESYTQALHREVSEEIGAEVRIEFLIGTTHFYRGEPNPENELLGVVFGCTLSQPQAVTFGEEHDELRWATPAEIDEVLPRRYWLRDVIRRAERLRALLPEAVRQELRAEGFEL